ncbi:MotB family protein [Lichenifustis flavocetrariae]|uniref:MotB family protein n=1 Tax=Lichenifustis flavocetrariae TaxID=2949735 RepID=A0AA41YWE1_9HYPH|nr:MotB family protein [Lichenifustis flavocetrariae]MCW6508535.1 MotB family protein [Lichenifustis flavocetrariae]
MSEGHHEVVIIKRGGGDHEEGHHGGAWKIAFADFMTAMMAFFLVMWLISASDKTKAVIAHYFNPVQLVDSTPQPKGMQDLKADAQSIMKYANGQTKESPTQSSTAAESEKPVESNASAENKNKEPDKTAKHEAEMFRDPYAVLAEIAAKNDAQPKMSKKASTDGAKGGAGAVGLKGGEAYRDPFEPVAPPAAASSEKQDAALAKEIADAIAPSPEPSAKAPEPAKSPAGDKSGAAGKLDAAAKADAAGKADTAKTQAETPQEKAQVAALEARIAAATKSDTPPGAKPAPEPKLEVRHTSEGLVITLTDGSNFAMFASASAEPSPQTVALMAKIGRLLKTEKGAITLRGFTDNRPFKSDTYDNWRLSTARADMAHYMLVRGGLDDARIERIEGYADRRPKNPKDPGSAENRRIEILLRETTP